MKPNKNKPSLIKALVLPLLVFPLVLLFTAPTYKQNPFLLNVDGSLGRHTIWALEATTLALAISGVIYILKRIE